MARTDPIADLHRRITELERRAANQHREGKVTQVDNDKGLVIISDGIWTSGWIAWHEHNSPGGLKTRSMPKVGAQAVVKAVSGNLENGTATYSVYPTALSPMPDAKNGEHVVQMGADDPSKGKQVKMTTDTEGNHSVSATDSHTKTVGQYSHTMTKDGGHVLKAGDNYTYTMTATGGHKITAGQNSYTMDETGHTFSTGGQTMTLTAAGILMSKPTAFGANYGLGSSPGVVSLLDNAGVGGGFGGGLGSLLGGLSGGSDGGSDSSSGDDDPNEPDTQKQRSQLGSPSSGIGQVQSTNNVSSLLYYLANA